MKITGMVVGEVVARESAIRFVEHRHMRFDAMLMDQPAEHLGRAIGTVAHEPGRIETEAIVDVDQIVGGARTGCHQIAVGEFDPTANFSLQHDYLVSKRRVLRLKLTVRLERGGQDRPNEADQRIMAFQGEAIPSPDQRG